VTSGNVSPIEQARTSEIVIEKVRATLNAPENVPLTEYAEIVRDAHKHAVREWLYADREWAKANAELRQQDARINAALKELAACHGQAADRARAFLNGETPWPKVGERITGEDVINGGEVTGTFVAFAGLEMNYQVTAPMGARLIRHGTARAAEATSD
jgi:hypothetical protein